MQDSGHIADWNKEHPSEAVTVCDRLVELDGTVVAVFSFRGGWQWLRMMGVFGGLLDDLGAGNFHIYGG